MDIQDKMRQEIDMLLFGETYTEIAGDGSTNRIEPSDVTLTFDKNGKQTGASW